MLESDIAARVNRIADSAGVAIEPMELRRIAIHELAREMNGAVAPPPSTLHDALITHAYRVMLDEYNDCGVRAMAAATGVDYKDCHEAFERAGRKHGGSSTEQVRYVAAWILGYELSKLEHWSDIGRTPREFAANAGIMDRMIFFTANHASGMGGNEAIDDPALVDRPLIEVYWIRKARTDA